MAFDRTKLGKVGGSNGFTIYHYNTDDTDTVVSTSGYFSDASDQLRVGDHIIISADLDGTPFGGMTMVISNTSGVVDVADVTGSSTDTE